MQKISPFQPGLKPEGNRDFPRNPLPVIDLSYPAHALPTPLTPVIGREPELEQAQAKLMLPEVRLLSLIGSPGVGKTRLALELAMRMEESFEDVYFVSLASVFDPSLVMTAIARAVHLADKDTLSALERLKIFFAQKQALLVLDTFEHVLPAATHLVEVLASCPHLKLVVTSRAALQVRGEYELVVKPFALPDLQSKRPPDELAQVASVALLLQRIEAVKPEFQLTEENAAILTRLCQQLAGIPLAIELAATRCKVMSLQAISSRLEQGLSILSGISQDSPAIHHSLHDTINWSYELLSPDEQALFRCLSVFVGNFTLDAAESVAAITGRLSNSNLDSISSLIDKSLLHQHTGDESVSLLYQLSTIRKFGLEQLELLNELSACREAHATYYLALAEQASKQWHGPEGTRWLHMLKHEYENIQAALAYFLEQNKPLELLRFTAAMGFYWFYKGYLNEGRSYLEQALARQMTEEVPGAALSRAYALYIAGVIAYWQNDSTHAYAWIEESEHIYRQNGDEHGLASTLLMSGILKRKYSNQQEGDWILQECLGLCRHTGNEFDLSEILNVLGFIAYYNGELDKAELLLIESQALARKLGNAYTLAQNLYFMAKIGFVRRDFKRAFLYSEESLRLFETADIPIHIPKVLTIHALLSLALGNTTKARALLNKASIRSEEIQDLEDKAGVLLCQGLLALKQKEYTSANALFEESMKILLPMNIQEVKLNSWILPANLEGLGIIAFEQGNITRCVSLFALADVRRQTMIYEKLFIPSDIFYNHLLQQVKQSLGEETFTTVWTFGQAMALQQALDPLTMETNDIDSIFPNKMPLQPCSSIEQPEVNEELTRREVEVLGLIAQGLTNNSIAEQLVISPHTVNRHVQSIYQKLGVNSRIGATRYAFEHDLG